MATVTHKMANDWNVILTDSDDQEYKRKAEAFKNNDLMLKMYSNDEDPVLISIIATEIMKNFGEYVYDEPVPFAKWYN